MEAGSLFVVWGAALSCVHFREGMVVSQSCARTYKRCEVLSIYTYICVCVCVCACVRVCVCVCVCIVYVYVYVCVCVCVYV